MRGFDILSAPKPGHEAALRARITAWYFTVLVVAFASFAWISDLGFRHSIERL